MTLRNLIERLEALEAECGSDTPVWTESDAGFLFLPVPRACNRHLAYPRLWLEHDPESARGEKVIRL